LSYAEEYLAKLVSAEEAVKIVKDGDWLDWGQGLGCPHELDKALADRKEELKDIKIRNMTSMKKHEIWKVDPNGETFTHNDWHFGGFDRKQRDVGNAYYIPMLYRDVQLHYRKTLYDDVDVAMLRVTPMNKHGYFNYSCAISHARAVCDVAKKIILEVNPNLPWAMGGMDECIHISEVDYIVEADTPLEYITPTVPTEEDKVIAGYIMEEIPNGACIQLGIGGLPNTVGTLLTESDVKDLSCFSEMLCDAFYHLYQAGKLTNKYKGVGGRKAVYGFALGSQFLYDWIDNNPGLAAYPTSFTNAPSNLSKIDNMMSINNCIEMDLYGQISSESSGTRHISGTGGQLDFATGAYMSNGGKSFICCTSSYKDKQGNLHSRIVPTLPPGSIVTVPRTQAHYIVTEFGKCNLAGRSTWERAERIIGVAHPDLRDGLIKEAENMKIWRKSNKL
jgi:butyryl-CoA:acetate CoA-transferase